MHYIIVDMASKMQPKKVKAIEMATRSQNQCKGLQKLGRAVWLVPLGLKSVTSLMCISDLILVLDNHNVLKVLTMNILTSDYNMYEGSQPLTTAYHIYYRVLKLTLILKLFLKNSGHKILLIQSSTPNGKNQILKMIH